MIYSAEFDKLQYLLKMYLRIRIKKVKHILVRFNSTPSISSKISKKPKNS
jgi:hypothetical protein